MPSTIAFVMDPLERVTIAADTSFAFMLAAAEQGFSILHVDPADVQLRQQVVWLRGREVTVFDRAVDHFRVERECSVPATDCAAIFIRTDPPFDQDYVTVTWLLSFAEDAGVAVLNSPRGLRSANEKLYALNFPQLCPPTLVSSAHRALREFVEEIGPTVIKPLDGHGGFGVIRIDPGDSNTKAILDLLTREGHQPIMAQQYLPEAREGDRRLFLIDGELRAAVLRVPPADDHRSNVHVGGAVRPCPLIASDHAIAQQLADRLRADGLRFVGLDVIGDRLIEVNVTSPTLVRELRRLGGPDLAAELVDRICTPSR